ncbi:MAG: restriction endonuclease subunit S [Chloroflexales bacterium]
MTTATRPPTADRQPPEGLSELPLSWVWTKLGAVLSHIEAGRSPKNQGRPARDGEFGVLKVSAVSWGEFLAEENKALLPGDIAEPELTVRAGDLLISRANTSELIAAVVYVAHDHPHLMLSDKTLRLVPASSDVSAKYLLYALRTPQARDFFARNATGTSDSMRNISQEKIREVPIPLPPPAEQRRIVARVEALLTQARTAREALAPLPALVKRLRQAVLAAAFSGRLSQPEPGDEPAAELLERIRAEREQPSGRRNREVARPLPEGLSELPEGWAWATVEELAAQEPYALTDGPFGSNLKTADYVVAGVRVIRLQNIGIAEFRDSNRAYISEQKFAELQKHEAQAGDVIIAALADPVGRACLVPEGIGRAIVKADCIRLRLNASIADPKYVTFALNTPAHFKRAADATHGVGRERINLGAIRNFAIPLAPLAEQRRIVARVEALLSQADVIEAAARAAGGRIADIERAVLARAFRGELVEQEAGDEAAGALLGRIGVGWMERGTNKRSR